MRFFVILLVVVALVGGGYYYMIFNPSETSAPVTMDKGSDDADLKSKGGADSDEDSGEDVLKSQDQKVEPAPVEIDPNGEVTERFNAKFAAAQDAWKALDFYTAYFISNELIEEGIPVASEGLVRDLFSRSQQAHWMTRNVLKEPWAGKETVTWIRNSRGKEYYAYVVEEDERSITIQTKRGSTMGIPLRTIEERREVSRENYLEAMLAELNERKISFRKQFPDRDNAILRDIITFAWANDMTPAIVETVDWVMGHNAFLGWYVYRAEAKKLIRRILFSLGKSRKRSSKKIDDMLRTLRTRYSLGGFADEAEMLVYGSVGGHGNFGNTAIENPEPGVRSPSQGIRVSTSAIGSKEDEDANQSGDADEMDDAGLRQRRSLDTASLKVIRKEARNLQKKAEKYFKKADPENEARSSIEEVTKNLKIALAHFLRAKEVYELALEKVSGKEEKKIREQIRGIRRWISICRKMKRID